MGMREAEILVEIGFRTDTIWVLLQWWVSISFALMAAAYIGASKLTGLVVAVLLSMYALTFMTTGSAMVSNQGFNTAAIESLSVLSETMQLSPLGLHALESLDGRDSVLFRLLFWVSFFFTNGIVLYSYKRKCEKAYRVTSTRPNT
ncbi:MAG: hypothetical protein ACI8XU_000447 [Kiritimatiellia bacterium]|jgi:hypothetical protein